MGYIKLDRKAFFHNLDYFSNICTKDKLSIALKDNAYGHGTYEIGMLCKEYGIKHVFVRDMREADIAKQFGFETILVLYDIPSKKDDKVIVSINSLDDLVKIPKNSKIEIKIDTGMNRNGITESQLPEAFKLVEKNTLTINGIFTHFCCADEDNDITKKQENRFQDIVSVVKKYIDYDFRVHCANSAGVHKVDMTKYDLARIGIGVYGYIDLLETKYLKPVMSLYAAKIATKHIKTGDHVGYGSYAFTAHENMVVSNYDIGYGNGFLRLGDKKRANIANGKQILGRVSMDSFSIEGDDPEVCVFNDVSHLASVHDTINYEIFTTLSPFIKRLIV